MADFDPLAGQFQPDRSFASKKSPVQGSRSFTFSISQYWKPTKEPFLQWIKDLPGPDQYYEKPVEPARYHTLKHSIGHDDSDDEMSEKSHPHKRAKTSSSSAVGTAVSSNTTTTGGATVESRRRSLIDSSRGIARRVSSVCQRVITPVSRSQRLLKKDVRAEASRAGAHTPAPEPTPSPGTPSFAIDDRPKMRFVFVGDSQCGKSSMLLRFYRNAFVTDYVPTHYELFHKVFEVDGQDTDIELWDTSGDLSLEQLARLSYLAWDAVFLCFSVNNPRSFNSARTEWITRIRQHAYGAPIIFVGTKTDQRVGPSLWAPLYPNLETRITATEGSMTATAIGATRYVECSALTGQGIEGVFIEGVRAVSDRRASVAQLEKKAGGVDHHLSGLVDMLCFK
ncbi:P-loop containing nucleoside triphosphate hydrolase protein [Xylariaceae sp. FL0594]|nr:P-loop containing nucleoside triphosphate hydrolase protein [Xylariaceae sp. FL0594]